MRFKFPNSKWYKAILLISIVLIIALIIRGYYVQSLVVGYIVSLSEAYRNAVLIDDEEAE